MNSIDWSHAKYDKAPASLSPKETSLLESRLRNGLSENAFPFLDYSFLDALEAEIPKILSQLPKVDHIILLGVGGSSLGAMALQKAFCPEQDWPGYKGISLLIADNIDSLAMESWMSNLTPQKTLIIAISKSGGTIETLAQYFILKDWLIKGIGSAWTNNVVIITDSEKGFLREEATQQNIASLPVPLNMGGRYSALSAVGLFPAACLHINWKALIHGAKDALSSLVEQPSSLAQSPALRLALWASDLIKYGYSQLIFFSYIPAWNALGQWFAQLWAESLGKEGKGSMPIPAIGVTDQHSLQQIFLDGPRDKGCLFISSEALPQGARFPNHLPNKWHFLQGKRFGEVLSAESLGTRMAMTLHDIPLVHLTIGSPDEYNCGRLMGLCMATTLLTGWILDIDPLDQPAVELGKRLANSCLGAPGYAEENTDMKLFLQKTEKAEKQPF